MDPKEKSEVKNRVFPFVTDFNLGLPNIGAILKQILSLDSELCKVINPDNIFPSYRGTKTIKDLFVHSKLNRLQEEGDSANEMPESYKQGIYVSHAKTMYFM